MNQKLLYCSIPFILTGCIGSIITDQTEYFSDSYPDIRTVPERKEALAPRGLHEGMEAASRGVDLKKLQQDWEKINARDQALREGLPAVQPEVLAPCGLHEGMEVDSRGGGLKKLQQDWEKINARDKALREGLSAVQPEE